MTATKTGRRKLIMEPKTAEEQIKEDIVQSRHHPQKDINFNLSDLDGTNCGQTYYDADRDGKTLLNGQRKSFPDYKGKIRSGIVYHHINNMWWVIASRFERLNIASFQLFDDTLLERIKRNIPKVKISMTVEALTKSVWSPCSFPNASWICPNI